MKKKGIDKKKIIRIVIVVLMIVVLVLLLWFLYFYPNKVFRDNEKLLEEAGKRYYEINSTRLPNEEGRVISVSLNTLVKQKYLDGLYEAYGNKLCDLNESNVKAVNKDGDYTYYTYLKCGNHESKVDHDGPVITLNGSKNMTVSRGDTFNDPGVKSVVDNVDGNMDKSSVSIKGEVDTSKVGVYEITYTISDSLANKTEVTRKVSVEESLASTVKSNTENGYYVGNVDNNYIYFNNMLFRIVRVNDDNSVLIISNDALANVDYTNDGRFTDSALDKWLNDYFYNLLEPSYQDLIKSSSWCDDVISSDNITTTECSRQTDKRRVGILSLQDYNLSYDGTSSYLDKSNFSWYANLAEDNKAWAITSTDSYPNTIYSSQSTNLLNVVPALNLKASTTILEGDGTYTDPYVVVKRDTARRSSELNKRQVGEYVSYSGYLFRISNILDDGTTEVIMDSVLKSNNRQIDIGYTNGNKQKVYNPNQEGNIGYKIKNDMTRYINTDLFVSKKISVPIYNKNITYQGKKDTKEYKLLITIPSTFDIFSARSSTANDSGYWLRDSSKQDNTKAVVRSLGTLTYSNASDNLQAGVKVLAYFDKDVIIESGKGTYLDPYTLID